MPFKLRLKKSKQYNVASKSLYVVSVELLDNTVVECTLAAESSGQDCLNNVCQRLCLYQPEFFGLMFLSKKRCLNWVELERPLKKQLEKYSHDTSMAKLYLGVQYYISDVNLLQDEMTRYQYFLQLKTNIINGNLLCDTHQAVVLASYSLQAEFGDHDQERHTSDYLKDFVLLPKHMTTEETKLKALTEEVRHAHRALQGMAPTQAEVYYIVECQKLDRYGWQCHPAKDESGNELLVCPSVSGIILKRVNGKPNTYFNWSDILNLVHHKRTFVIECQRADMSTNLHLDDMDSAKYVWKMCVLQHRFYTKNLSGLAGNVKPMSQTAAVRRLAEYEHQLIDQNAKHKLVNMLHANSQFDQSLEDLSGLTAEEHEQYENHQRTYSVRGHKSTEPSAGILNEHHEHIESSKSIGDLNAAHNQQLAMPQTSSSVSLPGLVHANDAMSIPMDSEPFKRAYLPAYRPAPDYETAIRHKYGANQGLAAFVSPQPQYNRYYEADSLPELTSSGSSVQLQTTTDNNNQFGYSRYQNFNDLSHLDTNGNNAGHFPDFVANSGQHMKNNMDRSAMLGPGHMMTPPAHTYSTPELTSQGIPAHITQDPMLTDLHLMYQYKPPPPYPYNQRSSSSTPDLPSQNFNNTVSNSSPDLVYRKLVEDVNKLTEPEGTKTGMTTVVSPLSVANDRMEQQPDVLQPVHNVPSLPDVSQCAENRSVPTHTTKSLDRRDKSKTGVDSKPLGPMMVAAMNGLTLSRPDLVMDEVQQPAVPTDPRMAMLQSKLAEGTVFAEFEQIPKEKASANYKISSSSENSSRNRFRDVLPYDDNRVRLAPTKENKSGYINASHISVTVGNSQRFYIAAQGPLQSTVHSFWQMVWEQNVQLVVMLTQIQELGKEKCFLYWPNSNKGAKLQFGDFEVSQKFSNRTNSYITSSLTLYHSVRKQQRSIWHIQYIDWPDHGCPEDAAGFLSFMEEIDSVRRHAANDRKTARINKNAPVVVHCTAGVGRTGVTLLTDIMLYSLDHNQEVNVPKVLNSLRQQRTLIVQTLAQYQFVYQVLIEYLRNNRLI